MASLNPLQGPLGHRRAAHLLRRTSFRYTKARVDELAALTPAEALASLLQSYPLQLDQPVYAPSAAATPVTWINPPQPPSAPLPGDEHLLTRYVVAWWVHEALHDPGATHRLSLFLHQFLAVDSESGSSMEFFDYLGLLRWGSLGNFKRTVTKMVTDNCMLRYIDNDQNYVNNPNENFAREFFELHTIGIGQPAGPGDYTNYTEEDIVAAARVFTGFNHAQRHQYQDAETGLPAGRPYPQSHDFQPKTFSARFGGTVIPPGAQSEDGMRAELQAFVDMVFAQEATARNLCRRLYHFLVTRQIPAEVETDIIGPLAQTLISNNFELKPVLEQLLQSEHFFDQDDSDNADEIVGALIKSPVDLVLQALSFFHVPVPDPVADNPAHYVTFYNSAVLERLFGHAGLYLFSPPDVAGYPGYFQDPVYNRMFFNSATIIQRYKLPEILLTGTQVLNPSPGESIGTRLDMAVWVRDHSGIADPSDPYVLVQEILAYLLPEAPSNERFNYFYLIVFLDQLPSSDWTYEWQNFATTGDDTEVKIPLGRLLTAVMYSPEFQIM